MNALNPASFFSVNYTSASLSCKGEWTLKNIVEIKKSLSHISLSELKTLNGKNIQKMDSAGALLLSQWLHFLPHKTNAVKFMDFKEEYLNLLKLVRIENSWFNITPPSRSNFLTQVGMFSVKGIEELFSFLSFLGETVLTFLHFIFRLKHIPWRSVVSTVEETGVYALPIIGLLSFLIGIVLGYQMGLQLRSYGANIYLVDLLGIAILREFAPLMTAIIVAGRSGSAFTAKLGTMKIREEIDALRTMGLSPLRLLILPKFIALFFVTPLLTVWASIFGVFGGMLVAKSMLHITYIEFLHRFYTAIPLNAYFAGMIKAPVFGVIVAAIGCFQGMKVSGSAESVGLKTTASVVQSIFFIIVADALFSIIFKWFNF